jgi:hypothetical protein
MVSWDVNGNAGTTPDAAPPLNSYLGTSDLQALVLATAGAERLRIDTSGNLGSGTKQPLDPVHVKRESGRAGIRLEATSGPNYRTYSLSTAVNDWSLRLRDETGGYDLLTALWWNANIILGTPTSHVGIGVGAPEDKIHLFSADGPVRIRLEANNGVGSFRAYSLGTTTDGYDFHLRDETGARDLITASWRTGNLGVGINSPDDKIHLYSAAGSAKLRLEANNGAGSFRAYSIGTTTNGYDFHLRDETGARDLITASWRTGHVGIGAQPGSDELTVGGQVKATGIKFADNSVLTTAKTIVALQNQLQALGTEVSGLINTVNFQQGEIDSLKNRVSKLEGKVAAAL